MNNIRNTVSKTEAVTAFRRKSPATIAGEILENVRSCTVPDMTFVNSDLGLSLTNEDKQKLEAFVQKRFEIWANSWVAPGLNYIAGNIAEE